jgi:hypothetical protein
MLGHWDYDVRQSAADTFESLANHGKYTIVYFYPSDNQLQLSSMMP